MISPLIPPGVGGFLLVRRGRRWNCARVRCPLLTLPAAWAVVVFVLVLLSSPSAVHATTIAHGKESTECVEVERTAGIVQAEVFSQPPPARIAVLQIVVREARSRRMSVCQLSSKTWFVTVYRYGRQHPESWTARQFVDLQSWALALADDVLADRLPDETHGAMHFDGKPCALPLWRSGAIYFCQ